MISPHSDALVAERAGFPERTVTGVYVLGRVVSALSQALGLRVVRVQRLAAVFTAPVFIDATAVEVTVRFWLRPEGRSGRQQCDDGGAGAGVFFEVEQPAAAVGGAAKRVIKGGYVAWGSARGQACAAAATSATTTTAAGAGAAASKL